MLSHDKEIPIGDLITVESLIVLDGVLHQKTVRVPKDNECNTNVVSTPFLASNRKLFKIAEVRFCVNHSQKGTSAKLRNSSSAER